MGIKNEKWFDKLIDPFHWKLSGIELLSRNKWLRWRRGDDGRLDDAACCLEVHRAEHLRVEIPVREVARPFWQQLHDYIFIYKWNCSLFENLFRMFGTVQKRRENLILVVTDRGEFNKACWNVSENILFYIWWKNLNFENSIAHNVSWINR
jgi:hypothetical protein